MQITFDPKNINSYRQFLQLKRLPAWHIRGRLGSFPDQFADRMGMAATVGTSQYTPEPFMFDYQRDVATMAVERRKFAVFADCGLGKTLIHLSYARHVAGLGNRVLILTPPLVVRQTIAEAAEFWGDDYQLDQVTAKTLPEWLYGEGPAIGITNYESLKRDTPQGNLGALILDESSILKSHYGHYAAICLRLGRGLDWKLCGTGTPAPNDRIEYANHAVFLDKFPTVNSFLAKYFVNRGQTDARWELKPHALRPFYRALSSWCIFLSDPAVYGWKDNCNTLPPIHTHIHEVEMTFDQRKWVHTHLGSLVAVRTGGITKRSAYGQVAKGFWKGEKFDTNKYEFIRDLIDTWRGDESTLVWCLYDAEQSAAKKATDGASLDGKTPMPQRIETVERFKAGEERVLISKPRILGFGLNLQVATRQVFSGLQDSYESYYQCVKRSNRIGSTKPLNVHIPVTDLEYPMVENVLNKADRVDADTREQEALFRESM